VVELGSRFKIGPFDIELVSVAHSIPESNSLILRTPHGNVLHTGDWKIDRTPVIGQGTDEEKLKRLGDEGLLAVIGDSTNAVRDGRSPSESDVAKTLAELIASAPARVAVTTFASNVARIKAVADAARACGREVVLVGRSMERVAQVARETGYLDGVQPFRGTDTYGYLPPNKVVALCTGSQGEPRAALSRIAQDDHPDVTLVQGDRVIFSSRTIPGNEKAVGAVINGLVAQNVEVITDRTHLVHVSGHPRVEEMEEMLGWVKPQILVPVHGEELHLYEHEQIGRRLGIKHIVRCRNGNVLKLAPNAPEIVDEIPTGRLYKDGHLLVPAEGKTISERRKLSFAGMVFVAIALTEKGILAADPEIDLMGIPEKGRDGSDLNEIAYDAVMTTIETLPKPRRRDPDSIAESVRRAVRAALAAQWGKKPACHVHVLVV
jgi:ribonuclease J